MAERGQLRFAVEEARMSDKPKPVAGRSYDTRNVGARAGVEKGENISRIVGITGPANGPARPKQFAALLERIAKDTSLDGYTCELIKAKFQIAAACLAKVVEPAGALRRALLDTKAWFGGAASWVGQALGDVFKSEAVQKTIDTVTAAGNKAAAASLLW